MTNPANLLAVLVGPKQFELQNRPLLDSPLKDDEVIVQVISTGICGSDFHTWTVGLPSPVALGHESAGVIVELGSGVKDRSVGERVVIEPGYPCLKCYFCIRGQPNTCSNMKHFSIPPTDGTLCKYVRITAIMAVPIKDTVSWIEAGCVQPLAVAVQLGRRANIRAHQTIVVFGCGALGLLIMAVCKAYGAKRVVAFDIEQSRVDFAVKHYATDGFLVPRDIQGDSMAFAKEFMTARLKELGLSFGVDVAIEVTGAESALQMGFASLRAGGTYVQTGLQHKPPRVPMLQVTTKDLTIVGTVRYTPGCFEDAVDLVDRKLVDVSPLVTSTYPLTKTQDAFEAQSRRGDIKIVIMNQE
ncbi:GroES-like protein [Rhizodiscina lignyota]|uniref:D-xylulose reductase n=1 Tax=Rhizodiscina lignyota TaxID=1504668 RepID=A0A9P4ILE8_9PEZI|nr:GroES-like protein [Rhizodiscina lignyota]